MKGELVRDKLALISHFSGRLRVRAETFRALPEIGAQVASRLLEEEGVTEASASPVTGSVLVLYDASVVQLPRLVAIIVRVGGLHGVALDTPDDWPELPNGGARVRAKFAELNAGVHRKSRGRIDLKVAVPAALSGTGLLMFLGGRRRRIPEWYDLMFWGFTAFINLNTPGQAARAANDDDAADLD